jgi:tripartite-type tricarboxylate transporter receptor subunit TctC
MRMMITRHLFGGAAIALVVAAIHATPVLAADSLAEFYHGKTITLVIGTGQSGGYDLSSRLISQHLGRFIPGNPTIICRNMPGASSVVAAQYVYNVAPKDGTTLAMFQPTIVSETLLGRAPKYDPERFAWIGRVDSSVLAGLVWHTSPVRTLADAKHREVSVAAGGASGTAATVPWALNRMLGTNFKVILGYPDTGSRSLAMERGEVEGVASTSWEHIQTKESWLREKLVRFLYAVDVSRSNYLPDVPALPELGTNDKDRRVLFVLGSTSSIGRALVSTPDVPPERLASLRAAFAQMVKDPQFVADAKKRGLGVDPLSGPDLQKLVADTMDQPADVLAEFRLVSQPPK